MLLKCSNVKYSEESEGLKECLDEIAFKHFSLGYAMKFHTSQSSPCNDRPSRLVRPMECIAGAGCLKEGKGPKGDAPAQRN